MQSNRSTKRCDNDIRPKTEFVVPAFFSLFIAGFMISWIAVVLPEFKDGEVDIPMTKDDLTWMIVLFDLGTLIVPSPSGYLMDRFGRLFCLRLSSILSLFSAAFLVCATSAYHLWAARFLAGMSKGIGYAASTLYVAEIAGPKIRGALNGLFITMMSIGGLLVVGIGSVVSFETLNWIYLIFPKVQFICLLYATESPYYFFIRNKEKLASEALCQVRNKADIVSTDKELELIRRSVEEEMKRPKSFSSIFTEKANRKPLFIMLTAFILQRFGGVVIFATYATTTLPSNEFWKISNTHLSFVVCAFIFALMSLALVDWYGRKPLLLISCLGTGLATGASAVFYYCYQLTDLDVTRYIFVPHVSVSIFAVSYTIGIGPIFHTLQGELFPTSVKGQASAIVTIALGICNFIIHRIYKIVDKYVGVYFMYLLSTVCCLITLLFTIVCIKETKGKLLTEIQEELVQREVASSKSERTVSGEKAVVAVVC